MLGFRMFRGVAVLAACLGATMPAFAAVCSDGLATGDKADALAAAEALIAAGEHKPAILELQALDPATMNPLAQQCRLRLLIEADGAMGEAAAERKWTLALLGTELDAAERRVLAVSAADRAFMENDHRLARLLYRHAIEDGGDTEASRVDRLASLDRAWELLAKDRTGQFILSSSLIGSPDKSPEDRFQEITCSLEQVNEVDRAIALREIRRELFPDAAPHGEPDRNASAVGEIRPVVPPLRGLVDGDVTCEAEFSVSSCGRPFGIKATCTNDYFESFAVSAVSRSARFLPAVRAGEYVPRSNIIQPFEFLGSPPEEPKAN